MRNSLFVFACVGIAAVHAGAADAPAPKKDAPSSPGVKLVDGMVGKWTSTDATWVEGGKTTKATKVTQECAKVASGKSTLCKTAIDNADGTKGENVEIFTWFAGRGHFIEVTSSGDLVDSAGMWGDDKSITFGGMPSVVDGKPYIETYTLTWLAPNELTYHAEGKTDGKTTWTFNATVKR